MFCKTHINHINTGKNRQSCLCSHHEGIQEADWAPELVWMFWRRKSILSMPRFNTQTIQPVAQSLYWLQYPAQHYYRVQLSSFYKLLVVAGGSRSSNFRWGTCGRKHPLHTESGVGNESGKLCTWLQQDGASSGKLRMWLLQDGALSIWHMLWEDIWTDCDRWISGRWGVCPTLLVTSGSPQESHLWNKRLSVYTVFTACGNVWKRSGIWEGAPEHVQCNANTTIGQTMKGLHIAASMKNGTELHK
jgi:hypothetical protein